MRARNTLARLEEEKKKKRMRRIVKRTILFTIVAAFLVMTFIQLHRITAPYTAKFVSFFSKRYLAIRELSVIGASEYADGEIRSYVEPIIKECPTILSLPVSQIKGFLYTRSYLKKAEVRKEFPGRIVIEVVEKKPVAMLVKGGLFLLDENGDMIRPMNVGENIDLPAITVEDGLNESLVKEMIKTACYLIQLDSRSSPLITPSELSISGGLITVRSLELKNKENKIPPIYFTADEIEKKVLYVKKLWPEIVNKRDQLEYVDGRFRKGVLVKLKTAEVKNNG